MTTLLAGLSRVTVTSSHETGSLGVCYLCICSSVSDLSACNMSVCLSMTCVSPQYLTVCFFSQDLSVCQSSGCSHVCFFCQKRLYVMERLSAEGFFFHRSCFQCFQCRNSLRLNDYAFDRQSGECFPILIIVIC